MKNKSNNDFCVDTLNNTLPKKNAIKYLEVMVDHKLTWEEHTRYVIQKLTKARGILAKLRHHAPQSILINVYYSIVYPHLYCGVTSWGNTAAKYTDSIQTRESNRLKYRSGSGSGSRNLIFNGSVPVQVQDFSKIWVQDRFGFSCTKI